MLSLVLFNWRVEGWIAKSFKSTGVFCCLVRCVCVGVVINGLVNTADRWRDFFSRKERADCNLAGRFDVCIFDAGRHCQNVSAVLKTAVVERTDFL